MSQSGLYVLPPAPDVCRVCATKHAPTAPHNAQSLYYQMTFRAEHGRPPTWEDALAHVAPELAARWRKELAKFGAK